MARVLYFVDMNLYALSYAGKVHVVQPAEYHAWSQYFEGHLELITVQDSPLYGAAASLCTVVQGIDKDGGLYAPERVQRFNDLWRAYKAREKEDN